MNDIGRIKTTVASEITAQWLANRGYTIKRAAANVGVSDVHLGLVLKGVRNPSRELVKRLKRLPKLHAVRCRVAVSDNK
ncbi:MAG: hypothetical protein RR888_09570 [Akkermansia sp.]